VWGFRGRGGAPAQTGGAAAIGGRLAGAASAAGLAADTRTDAAGRLARFGVGPAGRGQVAQQGRPITLPCSSEALRSALRASLLARWRSDGPTGPGLARSRSRRSLPGSTWRIGCAPGRARVPLDRCS
jgi:hypothetical protein